MLLNLMGLELQVIQQCQQLAQLLHHAIAFGAATKSAKKSQMPWKSSGNYHTPFLTIQRKQP